MVGKHWTAVLIAALALSTFSQPLHAQNVNVTTPFTSNSDRYFENFGVGFGFSLPGGRGNGSRVVGYGPQGQFFPNVRFSNGVNGAIPPFGGFNPNGAARFGFGNRNADGSGYSLGFNMAQGSNRQSITTAPSLTTQNGFGGSMSTGQVRPFVTGVIPVVGQGFGPNARPVYSIDNGVTRALQSGQLDLSGRIAPQPKPASEEPQNYSHPQSTAISGDISVSAIKAERVRKLAASRQRLESKLAEAKKLESEFKFAEARSKYREAILETKDKAVKNKINALIKETRLKD